ncbi:MAG: PAS domain S-box protein, partial [Planctomycetota bacterium]
FMPLVHEEDRERTARAMEDLLRPPYECKLEQRAMTRHGWRWIAWSDQAVPDDRGQVQAIVGVGRDVTDRKQAEQALHRSEQKYHALYNSMSEGVALHRLVYGRDGRAADYIIEDVNPAYERITGIERSGAIGARASRLYETQGAPKLDAYAAVVARGEPTTFDIHWPPWDKYLHVSAFRTGPGTFATVFSDITESHQAEQQIRRSEERFQKAFRSAPVGVVITRLSDGQIIDANDSFCRLLDCRREEIVGRTTTSLGFWDSPQQRRLFLQHVQDRTPMIRQEMVLRTFSNEPVEVLASADVIDLQGEPCLLAMTQDIRQQKRASRELHATRDRLEAIIEFLPDATFVIDREKRVIAWNRAIEEMSGVPADEMLGEGDYAYAVPFWGERRPVMVDLIGEPQADADEQYDHVRREGDRIWGEAYVPAAYQGRGAWVAIKASGLYDSRGERIGAIEAIRDVTERKQVENALRDSEANYREIFDGVTDTILICDPDTLEVLDANRRAVEQTGYEVEALRGRVVSGLSEGVAPYTPEEFRRRMMRSLTEGPQLFEWRARGRDGRSFWIEVHARQATVRGQRRLMMMVRDIEKRRRAEQELAQQRDFATDLVRIAPSLILVLDAEGSILQFNRFAQTLTGYSEEEAVGRNAAELLAPEAEADRVRDAIRGGLADRMWHAELPLVTRDGENRVIEWHASALHHDAGESTALLAIGHDVTDVRQKEEQLRQATKMEAIGRLAGGIAHDFNNQLTVVKGYAKMLLEGLDADDPDRSGLEEIERAAARSSALTSQLLAFSRKRVLHPEQVDLNRVVSGMTDPLARMIGEDICLSLHACDQPATVEADPNMVEEALMNLAINARDAMPQGGQLALTTEIVHLSDDQAAQYDDLQPGPYVVLRVSDTGGGMDAQTLE